MRIDFFEEFPSAEILGKAKLINFPSRVYIAASSVQEYLDYRKILNEANPDVESGYWPILKESYWISGLAQIAEIENLNAELVANIEALKGDAVMLDLELPFRNKKLFRSNWLNIFKTKKLIRKLFRTLEGNGIEIVTAEVPIPFGLGQAILRFLGIHYSQSVAQHSRIITIYTSILTGWDRSRKLEVMLKWWFGKVAVKHRLWFGLGLTSGVFGATAVLSLQELLRDLGFVRDSGSERAVIFSLNGLNQEIVAVIEPFVH